MIVIEEWCVRKGMSNEYDSIYKNFKSRKSNIDNLIKLGTTKLNDECEEEVRKFASGGDVRLTRVISGLEMLAANYKALYLAEVLRKGRWDQNGYAEVVDLFYTFQLLELFWNYYMDSRYRDNPKKVKTLSIMLLGEMLGHLSVAGWRDEFLSLTPAILNAFDVDHIGPIKERRAQLMMVRLAESYAQFNERDWESYAKDENLLNEIVAAWETEDDAYLTGLLIKLCNRHTHHARSDNAKQRFDFFATALRHFPIEVLMIQRLREWKGLDVPYFEHPLIAPPFDRLPENSPRTGNDVLEEVLSRVRSDYPFDEMMHRIRQR